MIPETSNHRSIVLRFHEIALKGDNRSWFENKLGTNAKKLIQQASGADTPVQVKRLHGRMILDTEWNSNTKDALKRVFGLANFSPMKKVKTDFDSILQGIKEEYLNYIDTHPTPKSFRISTRRSDKALPETSVELDKKLGSAILSLYPSLKVNLEDPDLTLGVEVRFNESFIWTEKVPGQGGLPVGTNASVLTLISGGLDSPVAAIQAMRRGSSTSFVHFHGTPFVGEESLEKVEDLVRIVNRFHPDPKPLYVIPFGKIQEKIALVTHSKMRTILYRRMMIRIANAIANQIGAKALITGESIGQVASQTIENLATINSVSTLPILRPLITYDKDDIIHKAKEYGTFATSIKPATDCCTLFADRHPALRTTPDKIEEQEKAFSVEDLVQKALAEIHVKKF